MTNGNGNGGGIALPHAPQRIGQATAIEQSRAAAEVHAAILVAQQCPRNEQMARRAMEDACRMKALAEKSSFRFKRGGTPVSGPTVHLARELARCWGNMQYGVAELSRDDQLGQSEMQAYAWDVQTNSRSVHVFIVPHKLDRSEKSGGQKELTDMRDIYENNANNGARRLREAIFAMLPVWFVEEAKKLCLETLQREDDGKSIHTRIAEAIDGFGTLGVREEQIAAKLGRPSNRWDHQDLAQLSVIFRSIRNGEISKEDEFPVTTVTAAEITASAASAAKPPKEAAGTATQIREALTAGEINQDTSLALLSHLTGQDVRATTDLTATQADSVLKSINALAAKAQKSSIPLIELVVELIDRPAGDGEPAGGAR